MMCNQTTIKKDCGDYRGEQMDPSSNQTSSGLVNSPGSMLVQKAYALRSQSDALMKLGQQMLQMEKQEIMSKELTDALISLLR